MTTTRAALCLIASIWMVQSAATAAQDAAGGATWDALEVARFEVDRDSYDTKEAERAGTIPDEMIDSIQRAIVGELTRSGLFESVRKAKPDEADPEEEKTLLLTGRVTDFKAGSRTARLWVGMGAGKQLIEVECVLTDRTTGKVVAKKRVIDRKVGGWAGGSEEKGLEDFAEKVRAFIKESMPS